MLLVVLATAAMGISAASAGVSAGFTPSVVEGPAAVMAFGLPALGALAQGEKGKIEPSPTSSPLETIRNTLMPLRHDLLEHLDSIGEYMYPGDTLFFEKSKDSGNIKIEVIGKFYYPKTKREMHIRLNRVIYPVRFRDPDTFGQPQRLRDEILVGLRYGRKRQRTRWFTLGQFITKKRTGISLSEKSRYAKKLCISPYKPEIGGWIYSENGQPDFDISRGIVLYFDTQGNFHTLGIYAYSYAHKKDKLACVYGFHSHVSGKYCYYLSFSDMDLLCQRREAGEPAAEIVFNQNGKGRLFIAKEKAILALLREHMRRFEIANPSCSMKQKYDFFMGYAHDFFEIYDILLTADDVQVSEVMLVTDLTPREAPEDVTRKVSRDRGGIMMDPGKQRDILEQAGRLAREQAYAAASAERTSGGTPKVPHPSGTALPRTFFSILLCAGVTALLAAAAMGIAAPSAGGAVEGPTAALPFGMMLGALAQGAITGSRRMPKKAVLRVDVADLVRKFPHSFSEADKEEIWALARECRVTANFAQRFSRETGKPVLVVGIKRLGQLYTWTIDDPLVQQLEEPEIERFYEEVSRVKRRNVDEKAAIFRVAQRWMDAGRLSWFVSIVQEHIPSNTGCPLLVMRILDEADSFSEKYNPLVDKCNPNLLFVDSSKYNNFPQSFQHVRHYILGSRYLFRIVGHPTLDSERWPGQPWLDLENSTDLKSGSAVNIVSGRFFRKIVQEAASLRVLERERIAERMRARVIRCRNIAIGLNPARRNHDGKVHEPGYFDDRKDLFGNPSALEVLRNKVRQVEGWYRRNAGKLLFSFIALVAFAAVVTAMGISAASAGVSASTGPAAALAPFAFPAAMGVVAQGAGREGGKRETVPLFRKIVLVIIVGIDADTIVLEDGRHVRFIGVDAPETRGSPKLYHDVERSGRDKDTIIALGKRSTEFAKRLLEGKKVRLEFDIQQKDRFERPLAYVYLEDGTFVNAELIRQGYAQVMTVPPNVKHAQEFLRLQREARKNNRGLWDNEKSGKPLVLPMLFLAIGAAILGTGLAVIGNCPREPSLTLAGLPNIDSFAVLRGQPLALLAGVNLSKTFLFSKLKLPNLSSIFRQFSDWVRKRFGRVGRLIPRAPPAKKLLQLFYSRICITMITLVLCVLCGCASSLEVKRRAALDVAAKAQASLGQKDYASAFTYYQQAYSLYPHMLENGYKFNTLEKQKLLDNYFLRNLSFGKELELEPEVFLKTLNVTSEDLYETYERFLGVDELRLSFPAARFFAKIGDPAGRGILLKCLWGSD
ncbi:MAG: thermonuclease family protein, partial [Candidatus Omnitrophota bacterium]|nr:thermonuclease family protein [Candidatus Omnitrophota bacterium]